MSDPAARDDILRLEHLTGNDISRLELKIETGFRRATDNFGGMLVVAVGVLLGFKFFS